MGITDKKYRFGEMRRGRLDLITDVPGVKVGHVTYADGDAQTGVTAVIPGEGSAFRNKFPAAVHVINGFGKSTGLMQIAELGTLETPILLTNTFSVPACTEGLLTYMLNGHPEIGIDTGTVNCVVTECNDSGLNAIRNRIVKPEDALCALENASVMFEEGAVGAGRGMKCYGYKGGIGSASRTFKANEMRYTIGALLLTNFGAKRDLTVCGRRISETAAAQDTDKGSCIMLLATDAPLTSRQLLRCTHRAQNGIARTGGITGGGSGEVVIMFSTANRIPHDKPEGPVKAEFLHEDELDVIFRGVAECVEESVISSMYHACDVTGRDGHKLESLAKYLD